MQLLKIFLLFFVSILLLACHQNKTFIEGKVIYFERIALPPQATLEITLEDVSIMDIPAPIIAQTRQNITSQVPILFRLNVDPKLIQKGHRYNLRAKILYKDTLLFITEYNPLQDSTFKNIELRVKKVSPHLSTPQ